MYSVAVLINKFSYVVRFEVLSHISKSNRQLSYQNIKSCCCFSMTCSWLCTLIIPHSFVILIQSTNWLMLFVTAYLAKYFHTALCVQHKIDVICCIQKHQSSIQCINRYLKFILSLLAEPFQRKKHQLHSLLIIPRKS